MQQNTKTLSQSPIFGGISPQDLPLLLQCLNAQTKSFAKNEYIFISGDSVSAVGVIISGRVQIENMDIMGNRILMAEFGPADLFAEALACAHTANVPVSALASEAAEVVFIDCKRIITVCPSSCKFHTRLVENLLSIVAAKNILLNQKIAVVSQRTLRDKLLTFLGNQAQRQGGESFAINFNRQELADYLCADRSAVSRELGRLKAEGLIDYEGSRFTLLMPN